MFASVLLPFAERGAGPLHHWVMLAQMSRFAPEEIVFIGDQACFDETSVPFGDWIKVGGLRFRCPTREQFRAFRRIALDPSLGAALAEEGHGHLAIFRLLLQERLPALEDALVQALQPFAGELEAVLTWSNCPSLRAALDRLGGIALIHNEIGPLRAPLYRETFYFDFQGVNGNTSPAAWDAGEVRAQMQGAQLLPPDQVRGLLVADPARVQTLDAGAAGGRVGVALQVEDDSNVIAYANGWTSLGLLYEVMGRVGPDAMLVRSHPGGRFRYAGGLGEPDDSPDSLAFLFRVGEVVSINSSVLVEAAFWGRRFEALGDNPVRFLARAGDAANPPRDWATLAFNTFFLAYLVPSELLFDPAYYRWRLTRPSLAQCHARHLEVLGSRGAPAIGALPATGDVATADGLVRLPAVWTSTLALEGRISGLARRADEAAASAAHWRQEAERNWDELSWFRQERDRLEAALAVQAARDEAITGLTARLAEGDPAPADPAETLAWIDARVQRLQVQLAEQQLRARAEAVERDRLQHEVQEAGRVLAMAIAAGEDTPAGLRELASRARARIETLERRPLTLIEKLKRIFGRNA